MKRLYLIRHAKSSWKDPGLADFERPLNKRGKRDAPFMGKRMQKYGVTPDLIITSPAKRARTTAIKIASEINYPKKKIRFEQSIYEGTDSHIFLILQEVEDSYNELILIGHNPDLTSLANYLSTYPVTNIPTCGIFCCEFEVETWRELGERKGIFKFFDYPKKHA